ncbi:MAG: glycosyltransferase family 2 protein [Candidatus Aminicenantes bacterium]|nr:glycosyltransferase family 2 protein [Candidatus Aminicenantes bacterium]
MQISVVVISYNSEKFLKRNLDSLVNQSVKFKQIIVVDNNSTDDSVKIIGRYARRHPQVLKIALDYNSGYAAGANIGIKKNRAGLLLVANADIFLEMDFNKKIIEKFKSDKEIALLSPLILRFDGKTVDSAGQTFSRALYPREIGFNKPAAAVPVQEGPVFSVCGAATVFRMEALEKLKIGEDYYDEDFYIFWEDFDIGWRANLLGLKTIFYPEVVVYHFRSATLKRNFLSRFSLALSRSPVIKYHLVKNRYLTLIKNFRFKRFYGAIPFIIFKDIVWVGLLTLSAPKIIIKLMRSTHYIKKAFKKRRIIKQRIEQKQAASTSAADVTGKNNE